MTQGIRYEEGRLEAGDGVALTTRAWLPEAPRAVLLVVHGLGEHSGRYDAMARWFAARGFAVHAYDHRGHGRSGGPRGHVDRFDDLVQDLDRFGRHVMDRHPELPVVPVGHSMGGLIVLSWLCQRQPSVAAAVTSGAALDVTPTLPPLKLAIGSRVARLLPRLPVPTGIQPVWLSRDAQVVERYLNDPLVFDKVSLSLGTCLGVQANRLIACGAQIRVPLLMLHGAADALCLPGGSRRFFGAVSSQGSDLTLYPELRHEIFNEPEREQVFADTARWLDAHLAQNGVGRGAVTDV